uniref:Transcriptional regulator, MarR family n=2 Tax=Actinomycetes TaxID=1760 RepID=A0A0F6WFJ6_9MICC|nr:MarR family transcriptional regulator [Micrococcus sp. MG-2010-D12]AKF15831.1 transcriptional regulator, MarR family [Micrococcus sp. MG-2010-D12]
MAVVAFNSTLRIRILVLIARSPGLGAHDLATSLDIPRATLSLNLRTLEEAGLLTSSDTSEARRGRRLTYRLNREAYSAMIEALGAIVER